MKKHCSPLCPSAGLSACSLQPLTNSGLIGWFTWIQGLPVLILKILLSRVITSTIDSLARAGIEIVSIGFDRKYWIPKVLTIREAIE